MSASRSTRLRVFVLLSLLLLGLLAAVLLGPTNSSSRHYIAHVAGTNVVSVSVRVTHGPIHTYYYPDRLKWEWDALRRHLGFHGKTSSEKLSVSPRPPADILWVAMTCREHMPIIRYLVAEELDKHGATHCHSCFGGTLDWDRKTALAKWPLPGGLESYRGKTFRIKTMVHGKELATIEFF